MLLNSEGKYRAKRHWFYHNHRRYKDGKRKGKTPMGMLSGEKQEKDWIELLFDLVEEKDPSFFAFSN